MPNIGLWSGFILFILAMLALDLGLVQRRAHKPRAREALIWSAVWIALAFLFAGGLYFWSGPQTALEFITGYLVEKTLSVDNLFVFLVVFGYFAVPADLQHRVLFWGIIGALVLRALFVLGGAALLHSFHWMVYVFGALLLLTAIRLFAYREKPFRPDRTPMLRLFLRAIPFVNEYRGGKFMVVKNGRRYATPLLLALFIVEIMDVVFAVDSIPAIFAITPDPFIVFTSNVFAMLGLRSLYFLLADLLLQFHYLKAGLSLVLGFVGFKMLFSGFYSIPVSWSLAAILLLFAGSILFSIIRDRRQMKLQSSAAKRLAS